MSSDRVINSIPLPPQHPLSIDQMIPPFSSVPSWELLRSHLQAQGTLSKSSAIYLITQAKFIFEKEPNIIEITDPVTIIGDIHGQFYDILKIFDLYPNPSTHKYLFLGDYVDRGAFSIEVILLLYSLKLNFPSNIILLRGNHESRRMADIFTLRKETLYKYDLEVFELIMESFDALPLTCVVNQKYFAVHAGLSPRLTTLKDIQNINRFQEPPKSGIFCDILWSDPTENAAGQTDHLFEPNTNRSISYFYGAKAVKKFLQKNKLSIVIRAHEAFNEGYRMYNWKGFNQFPHIISVFSAPNYCGTRNNKGAVINIVDNDINVNQFCASPSPYVLPGFMDVFSWSAPYIIDKIVDLFKVILMRNESENKVKCTNMLKGVIKVISRLPINSKSSNIRI